MAELPHRRKSLSKVTASTGALLLCLGGPSAHAKELLGVNFSLGMWLADLQGRVQSPGAPATETTDAIPGTRFSMFEIGVNKPKPLQAAFELRHHMSGLPRLIYRIEKTEREATFTPYRDIQYFEGSYIAGTSAHSTIDLSFDELTLYYTLVDSWWLLELGAAQRRYDGQLRLQQEAVDDGTGTGGTGGDGSAATTEDTDTKYALEDSVNMGFLDLGIRFADGAFTLAASIYQDIEAGTKLYDTEYSARFLNEGAFATHKIELGYRKTYIENLAFDDLATDLKFGGPYLRWTIAY